MFATIRIISGGAMYHTKWYDINELSLEDTIIDECYGIVESGDRAVVIAEIWEYKPEINYSYTVPDSPAKETDLKAIDTLTFVYDDKTASLELMAAHNVHKSLTTKTNEKK